MIADGNPDVTVLFADLVVFMPLPECLGPEGVVRLLNEVFFSAFDEISEVTGVEKIKTIGDECPSRGDGGDRVPDAGPDPSSGRRPESAPPAPAAGRWWPG